MGNPQIAEALFSAHAARATGWLTCSSGGRESRLGFRDGQLVQVDLRFGFQAAAQALVQAGRIELFQLDALWARGEAGAVEAETLEELGVTLQDAEAARALASVKQVLQLADSARFEAGQVDGEGLLSSARVVRAAWETLPIPNGEASWFRLRAPDALDGWDVTAEEREWLQDSSELRSAEGVVPQLRALLEVLAKGGAVEWIPAEEIRRREAEEQARCEAEEQARREAEEQARREAEAQARREAEAQARREAEEQARREAEAQARREAEAQARREAEEQA
ncbi:MAG: molecular chaperone DnaJ, partial [Myxococcales bacterium]|nr:molecular chaperone DnaJ [Myxococcales bacterium]